MGMFGWSSLLTSTLHWLADLNLILWGSFGISFFFGVAQVIRFWSKLGNTMGAVKWDFQSSWASTLTAIGALLGTIISSSSTLLPANKQLLSSVEFVSLNLFFGMLLIFAAFFYNTTRSAKELAAGKELQPHGKVGSFLASSGLTLWAVLGELITIILLVGEMWLNNLSLQPVVFIFVMMMILAMVLLLVYAWRSIGWIVSVSESAQEASRPSTATFTLPNAQVRLSAMQSPVPRAEGKVEETVAADLVINVPVQGAPLPTWSLL